MNIGIIGLGLIGGSLGLALRKAGQNVIGFDLSKSTSQKAHLMGAIDQIAEGPPQVAEQCQVIILATPILALKEVFRELSPYLREGTIVSDTASTKVEVMGWAGETLPAWVEFIGGHPMAGKERWGIEEADAQLLTGAPYCLTPSAHTSQDALFRLSSILEGIGTHPILLSAQEHDLFVAGISHLPLILSAALVLTTTTAGEWDKMSKLASSGYRDVSRLASGNPLMSLGICLTNRQNILFWAEKFEKKLKEIKRLLISSDREGIMGWFDRARKFRELEIAERFYKA